MMFWLRYPTENRFLRGFLFQVGGPRGLLTFTLQAYLGEGGLEGKEAAVRMVLVPRADSARQDFCHVSCLKRSPGKFG